MREERDQPMREEGDQPMREEREPPPQPIRDDPRGAAGPLQNPQVAPDPRPQVPDPNTPVRGDPRPAAPYFRWNQGPPPPPNGRAEGPGPQAPDPNRPSSPLFTWNQGPAARRPVWTHDRPLRDDPRPMAAVLRDPVQEAPGRRRGSPGQPPAPVRDTPRGWPGLPGDLPRAPGRAPAPPPLESDDSWERPSGPWTSWGPNSRTDAVSVSTRCASFCASPCFAWRTSRIMVMTNATKGIRQAGRFCREGRTGSDQGLE